MNKLASKIILLLPFIVILFVIIINNINRNISLPSSVPLSAWSWKMPTTSDIDYAADNNIAVFYVSVDHYIDIFEMKDEKEKAKQLADFQLKFVDLIQACKAQKISVHALAGGERWGESNYWYVPHAILDFVVAFNEKYPDQAFDGLQFDIEFYNSEQYKKDSKHATDEFLIMLTQVVDKVKDSKTNLSFGVTMPYWFDNENGNLKASSWNGVSKMPGFHMFDILNSYPNSYVALMDYKNEPDGDFGSIKAAKNEIEYASQNAKQVKVLVGQETEENEIEKVTFYKKGARKLISAIVKINNTYKNNANYAGVVIHTLQGVQALRP